MRARGARPALKVVAIGNAVLAQVLPADRDEPLSTPGRVSDVRDAHLHIDHGLRRKARDRRAAHVLDGDGQPKPVDVAIGISDGSFTEVVSGDLQEGQSVIIGINDVTAGGSSRRFTGFRL